MQDPITEGESPGRLGGGVAALFVAAGTPERTDAVSRSRSGEGADADALDDRAVFSFDCI